MADALLIGGLLLFMLLLGTGGGLASSIPSIPSEEDPGSQSVGSVSGPHPEYDAIIVSACADAGLGDPWPVVVKAIIQQESGWQVAQVGDDGRSLGLMQVNTAAHPDYDRVLLTSDPVYAIRAGCRVLGDCVAQWGGNAQAAIRCYNGCVNRPYAKNDPGSGQGIACDDPGGYWGYVERIAALTASYDEQAALALNLIA